MQTGTKTISNLPRRSRRAAEGGASLVEIMIVLVILLIGVFLAIRIFPTGFGVLRSNENRTAATRLAERMLSLAKGDAAENLPLGVLSGYRDTTSGSPTYGQLVVNPTQDPDDLTAYTDPSTGVVNPYFSNVNRFHYVKGEQVKIPLPTANATSGSGSVYTVKFGPIYIDKSSGVGVAANSPDQTNQTNVDLYNSYVNVGGAPLTSIEIQASSSLGSTPPLGSLGQNGGDVSGALRGPQSFLIDYGDDSTDAYIMFTPRAPAMPARTIPYRYFTVTYSYLSGTSIQTSTGVTVKVPDSTSPTWQIIPTTNNGTTAVQDLIPGSVTAVRQFLRIKSTDVWDTADPYQYKLAADNITVDGTSSGIATDANIGALLFNPAGANYSESTAYGQRPFTAYIDYAVLNWHILRDDISVPSVGLSSTGYVPIHTTISPIKQAGDSETDLSGNPVTYSNVLDDPNIADSADIRVYDLSNPGAGPLQIGNYRNPKATDQILTDEDPRGGSYRTGTIYVNTALVSAGATLRVLYQAEGDWAVSLQKAYAQYENPLVTPTAGGTPAAQIRPPYNSYDQFGVDGTGATARLWFPRSDMSKSVTISIEYQVGTPDPATGHVANQWIHLDPIQVTLDTLSAAENATDSAGVVHSVNYATAYLNNTTYESQSYIPTVDQTEFGGAAAWRIAGSNGIGTAQGTSVKARVIWHDSDTSNGAWRVQDLDSNLTPSP